MSPLELLPVRDAVVLIDLVGALMVVGYAAAALAAVLRTGSAARGRLLVAEGAVMGLSFKTAASLLKTLDVHTWEQIGMFAAVLGLRTLLKGLFMWERGRLLSSTTTSARTA